MKDKGPRGARNESIVYSFLRPVLSSLANAAASDLDWKDTRCSSESID